MRVKVRKMSWLTVLLYTTIYTRPYTRQTATCCYTWFRQRVKWTTTQNATHDTESSLMCTGNPFSLPSALLVCTL